MPVRSGSYSGGNAGSSARPLAGEKPTTVRYRSPRHFRIGQPEVGCARTALNECVSISRGETNLLLRAAMLHGPSPPLEP
jgi:hypothetical protein